MNLEILYIWKQQLAQNDVTLNAGSDAIYLCRVLEWLCKSSSTAFVWWTFKIYSTKRFATHQTETTHTNYLYELLICFSQQIYVMDAWFTLSHTNMPFRG